MGNVIDNNNFIDVICQHTADGNIIPLRIRVKDEDGMYQTFNIKGYKELSTPGHYTSPYGTLVHSHTWNFLCQIQILGSRKTVELFFNSKDNLWKLNFVS